MNKKNEIKSIIKKKAKNTKMIKMGVIFIVLLLITFFLFYGNSIKEILKICSNVKIQYLFVGIFCMILFILGEAINIRRTLVLLGNKVSIIDSIKYALVGFFFSSITPSSSGGQPAQVYFMKKDNMSISHSSLALLIELSSFQLTTIILAILGFAFNYTFLTQNIGAIKYLIFLGVAFNIFVLIILLLLIFSKKIIKKILNFLIKILKLFKYKKVEDFKMKCENQIEEYKLGAKLLKNNKKVLFKTLITSCLQILFSYTIPFWIYCSFGLNDYNIITFIGIQAVLYVSVSALPLPGAVGISEGVFILIYKLMYSSEILSSAMLLTRGINFYLFVFVSGISILVFSLRKKNT